MAKMKKETRIKKEDKRLRKIYEDLGMEVNKMVDGLICRAAHMRIDLEDFEEDIDKNGFVEMFTQSEKTDPYERERPAARLYNAMNKNYMAVIKQLNELLPKPEPKEDDDGFDAFVAQRE